MAQALFLGTPHLILHFSSFTVPAEEKPLHDASTTTTDNHVFRSMWNVSCLPHVLFCSHLSSVTVSDVSEMSKT